MRPDEALTNILCTYLWVFKGDGPAVFTSVNLNRDALGRRVQIARNALDPGDVDLTTGMPGFDLDTAYRPDADLLAPVAAGWQGASPAANGALTRLPLEVLPPPR